MFHITSALLCGAIESPFNPSWVFIGKEIGSFLKGKSFNPDNRCRKTSALNPREREIQAG